jgi:hypothetical protein
MNFDKKVKCILSESRRQRDPSELLHLIRQKFDRLERNKQLLQTHPENIAVDVDSLKTIKELIDLIQNDGHLIKDASGKTFDKKKEIERAFELTDRPGIHSSKEPKPIMGYTNLIARRWGIFYNKFFSLAASDRKHITKTQKPNRYEIFYMGTDGLPYVTWISFNEEDTLEGRVFWSTDRFNGIMKSEIKDQDGETVLPIKNDGTPINFGETVEELSGQKIISKQNLENILNSGKAQKAFVKRISKDPKLKAWYEKIAKKI